MLKRKPCDKWLELWIDGGWSTSFYLAPLRKKVGKNNLDKYPTLDKEAWYDIMSPDGKEFVGCRINIITHSHQGRGGMDESSSSSQAFFETDGLTIELKSGYLMRVNEIVTARQKKMARQKEIDKKLGKLCRDKKKIDDEIAKLLKEKEE